jgi:pimeloyl-ACP methyl ester carboxylesterase
MPHAVNPLDGSRIYYEDEGGDGPPVLFLTGFMEPLEVARGSGLTTALRSEFRLVFADHRGHGRSDKPYDVEAYALTTRCADVMAVLDACAIDRVHLIGLSWGARLGFALGEHARPRLASLTLCGNQPYAWDLDSPLARAVFRAVAAGRTGGMEAVVETFESELDYRHPEPMRTWVLENDPVALDAALHSILEEGDVSGDLGSWTVPCLIYVGAADPMHDDARRAADEIPSATFLSLPGHTHLSAPDEVDHLLPHVLELLRTSN